MPGYLQTDAGVCLGKAGQNLIEGDLVSVLLRGPLMPQGECDWLFAAGLVF